MTRLASLEPPPPLSLKSDFLRGSVVLRGSQLETGNGSDEAMELRYVLSPGENVSHYAHVEASRRRSGSSSFSTGDVEAATGLAIVVKQEWNVEREPIGLPPPCHDAQE